MVFEGQGGEAAARNSNMRAFGSTRLLDLTTRPKRVPVEATAEFLRTYGTKWICIVAIRRGSCSNPCRCFSRLGCGQAGPAPWQRSRSSVAVPPVTVFQTFGQTLTPPWARARASIDPLFARCAGRTLRLRGKRAQACAKCAYTQAGSTPAPRLAHSGNSV